MQVFFILFSVHFAVYQYINSKYLYRTHVKITKMMRFLRKLQKKRGNLAFFKKKS